MAGLESRTGPPENCQSLLVTGHCTGISLNKTAGSVVSDGDVDTLSSTAYVQASTTAKSLTISYEVVTMGMARATRARRTIEAGEKIFTCKNKHTEYTRVYTPFPGLPQQAQGLPQGERHPSAAHKAMSKGRRATAYIVQI